MPGRKWYVVAGVVFVVGVAAFGTLLFLGLRGMGKDLQRFVVPGERTVEVAEPGGYTIYRETGSLDGVYYDAVNLPAIRVVVTSPTGRDVPVQAPGMNETYTLGGREGWAIFRFQADEPGAYRVEARYPDGSPGPQGILAVGRGFTVRLVVMIFVAVATLLVTVLLTLGIGITTFVLRYRAGRRLAQVPAAPAGSAAALSER